MTDASSIWYGAIVTDNYYEQWWGTNYIALIDPFALPIWANNNDVGGGVGIFCMETYYYNPNESEVTAVLHLYADNYADIFINGVEVGSDLDAWNTPSYPRLSVTLVPGYNVLRAEVIDHGAVGMFMATLVRSSDGAILLRTDPSWRIFCHWAPLRERAADNFYQG